MLALTRASGLDHQITNSSVHVSARRAPTDWQDPLSHPVNGTIVIMRKVRAEVEFGTEGAISSSVDDKGVFDVS